MKQRPFGRTCLSVSELAFGGWAIGGTSFGRVERIDALRALARAEELGCNFVDTAGVYGDSEDILGEFLPSRRDRWIVATKYSGQPEGMTATLDAQLRRMKIEHVDFYQIHWAPRARKRHLYDELQQLKRSGRTRFIGVSLYSTDDIDYVLKHASVDGFQVAFSLLDPLPLVSRLDAIYSAGLGVIARSVLRGGLLSGKYGPDSRFTDRHDQRSRIDRSELQRLLIAAERFRVLEPRCGGLINAAVSYPLAFDVVSAVVLSTKNEAQASSNFSGELVADLTPGDLDRIESIQKSLGLFGEGRARKIRRLARRLVRW